MTAQLVGSIGPRCILGESPIWDERINRLAWVDIDSRRVHRWDWATDRMESRSVDGRPGCIALTPDPEVLVIASEHRIGLLHWGRGEVAWKVELPIEHPSVRLNDGRVSPSGDLWVGTMHVPASDRRFISSIYRVRPDWSWDVMVTEVGVANAMVGITGGMLWGDTLHGSCWVMPEPAGPTAIASGGEGRLIDFSALGLPGGPDGACTDASGGIWLACVHGSTLAHLTSRGDLVARIELPVRRPTCPAFGGPGLGTLFVTTIGGGGNYPVFEDEPDAGRVLLLETGARGVPEHQFVHG